MVKVFAFGTLKSGFPLHEEGLGGARFLGAYRTAQPFPVVVAGPWFAPMMLNQPGTGLQVRGELYEIDEAGLARLDALESIGLPGNYRELVQVEALAANDGCWAVAYMKSPALARPVHSGFLDDYQDRRFVPPWQRPG